MVAARRIGSHRLRGTCHHQFNEPFCGHPPESTQPNFQTGGTRSWFFTERTGMRDRPGTLGLQEPIVLKRYSSAGTSSDRRAVHGYLPRTVLHRFDERSAAALINLDDSEYRLPAGMNLHQIADLHDVPLRFGRRKGGTCRFPSSENILSSATRHREVSTDQRRAQLGSSGFQIRSPLTWGGGTDRRPPTADATVAALGSSGPAELAGDVEC